MTLSRVGTGQGVEATHRGSKAEFAISGKVVDTSGIAVRSATVKLRSEGSQTETACDTDPAGDFVCQPQGEGPFQLLAVLRGKVIATLAVPKLTSQPVILSMEIPTNEESARGEFAFADTQNFRVAGVTDWTAVGGHGSDTTLRTSEDLARTTAALRAADAALAPGKSKSEEQLQSALRASPDSYAANLELGEYYLHAAQYAQAVPMLRAASRADTRQAVVEYDLALACRGLGDLPEAKRHAQRALELVDRAEYHSLAGEIDEASGDPFNAVQQMERAVQLEHSESNYFAWASELLLHRAILQSAQIFARATALYPASARLRTGWGTALFAEAQYTEAAQHLCEASDLEPDASEPYLALGKADKASPAILPCVMERLERYLRLKPRDSVANFLVATALLKRDASAARAELLLERAVALNSQNAEALLELGKIAATRKRYAKAIELYRKSIAADPQLGEAHFRLSVLYARSGKLSEARQERELHEEIARHQADAVETERRNVKQFLVEMQSPGTSAPR